MAKKLTDDILRWTLEINGKPAQKQLSILEQNTYNLQKANKALGIEMAKLESQGKKNTDEWNALDKKMKENQRTINQAEDQMKKLRSEIGITGMTTNQLRKHMNDLKMQLANTTPDTAQWRKLRAELQATQARYGQLNTSMHQTNGVLGLTKKALGFIGFAAVGAAVMGLVRNMVSVRSEFEKYEAVLTNTLGSSKAAASSMEMIKKFAAETPFEVNNLTDAYVRLVNQGFQPTKDEMRKLGDLASSTGKDFLQLTEAILDAQVGEFERLKEFGIKAKKEGDNVSFSFKGVTTTVKASSQAIRGYILSLGDMKGVAGAMDGVSKTLGGRISNMKDAWANLLNMWGKETGGPIATAIGWITKLMTTMAKVDPGKVIKDEEMAVNRLMLELTDVNTQEARRKEIVTQLTDLAPDIVRSLDNEGLATSATTEALRLYNEQMISRIVLSRKQLDLEAAANRQVDATQKRKTAEEDLKDYINSTIEAIQDKQKQTEFYKIMLNNELTLLEKINEVKKAGLSFTKWESPVAVGSSMGSTPSPQKRDGIESYITSYKLLAEAEREAKWEATDLSKEVEGMKAEMGINFPNGPINPDYKPTSKAGNSDTSTNQTEKDITATLEQEYKRRQVIIQEYYNNQKLTKEEAESESAITEIMFIEDSISILKKHNMSTVDLENDLQKKISTLNEKATEDLRKQREEQYKISQATIEKEYKDREIIITESVNTQKITRKEGEQESALNEVMFLEDSIALNKKHNISTVELELELQKKLASIDEKATEDKKKEQEEKDKLKKEAQAKDIDKLNLLEETKGTYDLQLKLLDEMLAKDINFQAEHAKRVKKIHEKMKDDKIQALEGYLQAAMDLGNIITQFQEAAKNREIKAAGDNAKKKEEIEKRYAEKQRKIAIAQTIISGVLEIAKIWKEAGVLGTPLAIVMAGVAAARTIASVAVIESQDFDKGGYTPEGPWDQPQGVVHSDEFVANRFAVKNPNVKQFLDVFDAAQRTGQIRSLNTPAILAAVEAKKGGYVAGGYAPPAQQPAQPAVFGSDQELMAIIAENARAMFEMREQLAKGFRGNIVYTEFEKVKKEVDTIRSRTTMR